nr:toprim domain-containing protein [Bradyrhizobium diazoefficiens]
MIACCTDAAGQIRAIHQTWIKPDGSDKAAIVPAPDGTTQPARKVLGEFAGLVIPLWRGEGHFSVKEAEKHGLLQTVILTEGVEDGLSAILAAPQHRVWAMISLSNMVNVAARLPACIDSVIVHRQNDWDKASAVAAFDRGMKALQATGRAIAEVHATIGKDLNDTLRGAA